MKKISVLLFFLIFSLISISTATSDNSITSSLRGNIDESNIFTPENINWASGSLNANIDSDKKQSQGSLSIQGFDKYWEKFRFSLNWNWKGNYNLHSISNNELTTIIDTHARIIKNRNFEYWVPIIVKYHKCTNTVDIEGPDFSFKDIYVKDLLNSHMPECEDNEKPPVCEPQCQNKQCGSDTCEGTCGSCESGFSCTLNGQCEADTPEPTPSLIHDIALIDLTNAIGNIRLEHTNNSDILDSKLQCNLDYKVAINLNNKGNFTENVTFLGTINGLNITHTPRINLLPGQSSLKAPFFNFSLAAGNYTILIEAIIKSPDSNPADNIAQRDITILCEE